MRLELNPGEGTLGFQIAPMIDVVFVIMLFFMVMAGAVKVEKELNSQLPGSAETSGATEFVDEQVITIAANGEVMLNEEPMDSPSSRELAMLEDQHQRLKKAEKEANASAVCTVGSESNAEYGRTVDVLDALAIPGAV